MAHDCAPLRRRMLALLADEATHDVQIKTMDDGMCTAHRVILAGLSKPFHSMLLENFRERDERCIQLNSISHEALKALLHFAYSGQVERDSKCDVVIFGDVILDLISFADMWQITDLGDYCENLFLNEYLSRKTVISALNVACRLGFPRPEFKSRVSKLLRSFMQDIVDDESLTSLSEDALVSVLSQERMYIRSEADLMLGLCRWVQANYGDQEKEEQIARLKKLAPLLCLASMEATRLATILDFFLFPTDLFKQDVPRGPATVRRGKLSGFHFSPPQPWSHVTIDAMCRTATCNEAGNNIVHMDRELVEMVDNGAPSVTWHIKVVELHQIMLAGAGLPFESQEEVDMPCHGCGFTSYGDLFQAVLEWPDFTENLFACRRVNRLKYFTGSQLSFTFKMGQMQAGCRFADHEPVAVCEPCRKVRRHPYQFAHRHGTLAVSIQSPQCHKFNVSADVVLAKGAKLYPFVVLKRPGDCVEITDK